MIPAEVFNAWKEILSGVIGMLISTTVGSFAFASIVVLIVTNVILRISSNSGKTGKDD